MDRRLLSATDAVHVSYRPAGLWWVVVPAGWVAAVLSYRLAELWCLLYRLAELWCLLYRLAELWCLLYRLAGLRWFCRIGWLGCGGFVVPGA
jgi:hypothetical protein